MRQLFAFLVVLLFASSAIGAPYNKTHTMTAGTTALASEINTNYDEIEVEVDDNAADIDTLETAVATSAGLAASLSNETGSVLAVFNTAPTFSGTVTLGTTPVIETSTALSFGDNSDAAITHTIDLSGTDVVLAYTSGVLTLTGALSTSGTHTIGGTPVIETGTALAFGDNSDAAISHTVDLSGTDVVMAYTSAALAVTGALSATVSVSAPRKIATSTGGALAINTVTIATAAADYDIPDNCDSATGAWVEVIVRDVSETVSVTPFSGDTIVYKGASLGVDDELDSPGAILDVIHAVCLETDKWYVTYTSGTWTDGGVPD